MMRAILGFDCETDVGSWTPYYEGLIHGTPRILDLLKRHGITGTFFFSGDAACKNPEVVRLVLDSGHEVGCHSISHETVGDALFDIPGVFPLLPEEVENRLRMATAMVEAVAGYRPVSFRAPRPFGSTAVVDALESLGYVSDATYPPNHLKPGVEAGTEPLGRARRENRGIARCPIASNSTFLNDQSTREIQERGRRHFPRQGLRPSILAKAACIKVPSGNNATYCLRASRAWGTCFNVR